MQYSSEEVRNEENGNGSSSGGGSLEKKSKRIRKNYKRKFTKLESQQKHYAYIEHFLKKSCRICNIDDFETHEHDFIFCDECDDSYHVKCLQLDLSSEEILNLESWICPQCNGADENHYHTKIQQYIETTCYRCQLKLITMGSSFQFKLRTQQNKQEIVITESINNNIKNCRYCKHSFHHHCFSGRTNCLNCCFCEKKIRKQIVLSHQQFIKYLNRDLEMRKNKGLYQLEDLPNTNTNYQRHEFIGLRILDFMNDWQIICKVEVSLCYALKTNNLKYCNAQLYSTHQLMNLNKSHNNFMKPFKLHEADQKIYEKYRVYASKHYIPPLQIKQDYVKGFYVVAAQYIPQLTLLCEYAGEVCTRRRDGRRNRDNDSIMTLIVTQFAQTSLDITPVEFSNMSRFIMGIPPKGQHLQNVQTHNFCYEGRSHVIFYSVKGIEMNQILYIDYNDGVFQEYPNQHFIE